MITATHHHDNNHADDEMVSLDEAAAFLRVPVATLRYWRHCGDGPFSFKVGRHVRYWHSDLILWRAEKAVDQTPTLHRQAASEVTTSDLRVTMVIHERGRHGREHCEAR